MEGQNSFLTCNMEREQLSEYTHNHTASYHEEVDDHLG